MAEGCILTSLSYLISVCISVSLYIYLSLLSIDSERTNEVTLERRFNGLLWSILNG